MAVTVGCADRKLANVTTNRCLQGVVCGTCGVFQMRNGTVPRKRPEEVWIGAASRNAQVDGRLASDRDSTWSHRVCGHSIRVSWKRVGVGIHAAVTGHRTHLRSTADGWKKDRVQWNGRTNRLAWSIRVLAQSSGKNLI